MNIIAGSGKRFLAAADFILSCLSQPEPVHTMYIYISRTVFYYATHR
jgi:hypothetical protein